MDLRSRGEKGWRRIVDVWMYLCLIGMQLSLPALAEEYSSYLQSTGENADLISSKQEAEDKRSNSFFPLRGKNSNLDSPEIPVRYPFMSNQQLDDKRSQFYPLRGKKIPTELKRASYFMPMRGRKDDPEWSEEDSIEKRMSSFMPMRGRKDGEEDSADKRMSSFMPMRGRKDDDESVDADDSMEKRMSSFMPMRGRKDDYDSEEKRMSFMPMRGKKKSGPMMDGYNHFGKSGMYTKDIMNLTSSSSGSNSNSKDNAYGQDEDKDKKSVGSIGNAEKTLNHTTRRRSLPLLSSENRRGLLKSQFEFPSVGRLSMDALEKRESNFIPIKDREGSVETSSDGFLAEQENKNFKDYFQKKKSLFMPMTERPFPNEKYINIYPSSKVMKRRSKFMPMRGRRQNEKNGASETNIFSPFSGTLNRIPLDEQTIKELSLEFNLTGDNHTEVKIADFGSEDKRTSSFMPIRGRRGKNYFPYPFQFPSGIGSSLMARHYGGKIHPISSTWGYASKSRKFDWDSVKRAFHATRGKRFSDDHSNEIVPELGNLEKSGHNDLSGTPAASSMEKGYVRKGWRDKRSIVRPRIYLKSQKHYIALKRPMSFFATRGKRMSNLAEEPRIP
ncbi:hypothetical protein JTE90_028643 [Oedothorax gibbosus]|uniref:Uncharacterized protein n=1 Tax=Oedothorax gibbosus TaxID=931172 RepID=A0AAV6UXN1_9ARAC|nr:hypothetical protein JTE90_028643 [Oedothorax gibbosus]